jgi:putative membrane protein
MTRFDSLLALASLLGLSLSAVVVYPVGSQTHAPAAGTLPAQGAPAIAAAPAPTAATVVPTVVAANRFEIESSQMALTRSNSKDVREFANRLVIDHNLAAAQLKQTLASAKLPVPPEQLDAKHQAILDKLRAANADAFDKTYIEAQYNAHVEAIDLFKAYAKDGDIPRLKAFAADVLPPLQRHLDQVTKLR